MNNYFKINEGKETKSEYLTRMAPIIDSIQNGYVLGGLPLSLKELLPEEEQMDIKNYVFGFMHEDIKKEGSYIVSKYKLYNVKDAYLNLLYWEVWRNFHKYNNPNYKGTKGYCSFRTFVATLVKDPMRIILEQENNVKRYESRTRRQIDKTKKYLVENFDVSEKEMTPDLIYAFVPEVSSGYISKRAVKNVMNLEASMLSLDAEIKQFAKMESTPEEKCIASKYAEEKFEEFLGMLNPLQKFFLCQNYGFCSNKYDGMSIRELGRNRGVVRICKANEFTAKHIDKDETAGYDYVRKDFICRQKAKVEKMLVDYVKAYQFDEYDILSCLPEKLYVIWEELSYTYKLG